MLDSGERWDDLFALYDRALDHASASKRATLLEEAAQTAKDFADRPDRAIQYLEQLHELRPADAKLASALERLYERQGRHRELVALLSARLPVFKGDEARRARTRIAALWLEQLGDPGQALDVIEPLLEHPEDGRQRRRDGRLGAARGHPGRVAAAARSAALHHAARQQPVGATPQAAQVRAAAHVEGLRPAADRRVAAPALRADRPRRRPRPDAPGRARDGALGEGARAAPAREIGELYEKLGDAPNALEQIGAAMILDPGSDANRAKLGELAERMGRFERLADLLAAAADACNEADRRIALTMQAAEVRADRIGDAAGAIGLFTSVLESSSASDADVLAAAGRLSPLLEAAGRNEERLGVLERIAAVERVPEARRQALGRAARLSLQLGQPERAIELWERVVSAAAGEGDLEALDSLVELLDRQGLHARLVEVLAMRARAAASDEKRRADRVRIAKLLGETLGRLPDAIDAWLAIERDFGEADDAALALATLLRATRGWKDLAELLARRARRTDDEVTRGELLRQLGDVQREELDEGGLAVTTYERALEADPSSAGARAGLLALAGQEAHRAAALVVLLKALRIRDDWRAVLELTPHRLLAARSDAERIEILSEAAEISEKRAEDAGLAFEAMRRAFVLAPGDERTWSETARLAEAAGAWEGLVATYREAVDGAARSEAGLVARLRAAMGQVLETRVDDPRRALDEYLQVVRDAGELASGCAAVRVAGRLGRWEIAAQVVADLASASVASVPELLHAYEAAAEAGGAWSGAAKQLSEACARVGLTGAAARDLEAGVARWYRDWLDDAAAAEAAYVRALAHDPANVELLRALSGLQRTRRDRGLVETLLRLSRAMGGSPALLREATEVARGPVGDRPLAISILVDLLSLARAAWVEGAPLDANLAAEAPSHARWAVESLAELYAQEGDPARAGRRSGRRRCAALPFRRPPRDAATSGARLVRGSERSRASGPPLPRAARRRAGRRRGRRGPGDDVPIPRAHGRPAHPARAADCVGRASRAAPLAAAGGRAPARVAGRGDPGHRLPPREPGRGAVARGDRRGRWRRLLEAEGAARRAAGAARRAGQARRGAR